MVLPLSEMPRESLVSRTRDSSGLECFGWARMAESCVYKCCFGLFVLHVVASHSSQAGEGASVSVDAWRGRPR